MTETSFDLTGRVALVTGSSRGIGEAIARRLAHHGAHVVVSSRKTEACEAVAQSIRASGGQATARVCHIGRTEPLRQTLADIAEDLGSLDILVNNAAANPYFGPILDTPDWAFDKTVEVNLKGYFAASATAARIMQAQGRGAIVNIASVNAAIPGAWQGIYSITKAAIVSMTKAFAKELAPTGVRVNCVLPGFTDTHFASALTKNPQLMEKILEHVPQGRIAEPSEIAGAVHYLASDAASYTTGAVLTVDGGYLTA
jgi:NAD(P)-dependent dehydrogenase (short-subunit alcohol dehydrogenase family)